MAEPDDAPRVSRTTPNRRRADRARAAFLVQYREVGGKLIDATFDISRTGIFLRSDLPLPLDAKLELTLPEGDRGVLVVEGRVVRVVWGGRDRGRSIASGMAIEFENLSPTTKARLDRILHRIAD